MANITICDDDDDFADMLCLFLKSIDHNVTRCSETGQLASSLLLKRPDLLILDVEMPGGGAAAAARALKSLGAEDMPLIVCSGLPIAQQMPLFTGCRRVRFFQKPLDLDELAKAIGNDLIG